MKLAISNLVHKLDLGLAYQKTTFRTKISGVLAREHTKKFATPYVFLQPLKLAISNLVHKFGLGLSYQKKMSRTKICGVLARGAFKKVGR